MSPFTPLTQEGIAIRRRRLLIAGELGVGKTTALVDMLRYVRTITPDATMALLSFPGEKGFDSIPVSEPGLTTRIWQSDEQKKQDSHAVVREVERTVNDLRASKPTIFAGDGFHKYFSYLLDSVTDGAYFSGDEFEARLYGRAYALAGEFLSSIMHSTIPLVAFTCWTKMRAERAAKPSETKDEVKQIPYKVYPDLPPQLARNIVGEFSVAVIQTLRKPPSMDQHKLYHPSLLKATGRTRIWQTRPYGDVAGVTIKAVKEVSEKIPTFLPASYGALEQALTEAEKGEK